MNKYTLKSAMRQADSEDRISNDPFGVSFKKKDFKDIVFQGNCIFDEDWIVQKAEPKVLTPDEIYDSVVGHSQSHMTEIGRKLATENHKNGRLEMYLELRPFIESAREYLYGNSNAGGNKANAQRFKMRELFIKIKPL